MLLLPTWNNMDFIQINKALFDGFLMTIKLFIITFILAIPLGGIFCFLRTKKNFLVSNFMKFLIYIIRSTPLMLQIIIFFYVPGLIFNTPVKSRFIIVICAFSLNYGIYFSEIFRSGLENIPNGQSLAAKSLGLNKREIFFKVYLKQLIKNVLPPLSNETISLVKDTALARIISVTEVLYAAQKIVATYAIIWVLFYSAIFYLIFNGIVTFVYHILEQKLKYIEV